MFPRNSQQACFFALGKFSRLTGSSFTALLPSCISLKKLYSVRPKYFASIATAWSTAHAVSYSSSGRVSSVRSFSVRTWVLAASRQRDPRTSRLSQEELASLEKSSLVLIRRNIRFFFVADTVDLNSMKLMVWEPPDANFKTLLGDLAKSGVVSLILCRRRSRNCRKCHTWAEHRGQVF